MPDTLALDIPALARPAFRVPPTPSRPVFLSYERIEAWITAIAPALRAAAPTRVVGVLRGGAFPALLASYATGAPVSFLAFDRVTGVPSWASRNPAPGPGDCVLLCEDIAGKGVTLQRCRDFVAATGAAVRVLAIAWGDESRERPDFGLDMRGHQVVFPWERHTLAPDWRAAYAGLDAGVGEIAADHQWELWAFDLDGVFLPALPPEAYDRDRAATLARRDALPMTLPSVPIPERAVIISGRPKEDAARTRAWLEAHGLGGLPIVLRDPRHYGAEETARFKADMAMRVGATCFVESDPGQALDIAARAPHLKVMRYDIRQGAGVWLCVQPHARSEAVSVPPAWPRSRGCTLPAVRRA